MAVLKYLDVSTVHVAQGTMEQITERSERLPVVAVYTEGAILYVSEEESFDDYSADLRDVLLKAREEDCYLVRLDADADIIDGLAQYDW